MKRYYLGVDIGTCESKGVLVDESYAVAASASQSHVIENPRPNYFEMDAEIWWKDFCAIAKDLMRQLSLKPEQIVSVGTSVMGCDCLPVDKDCRPLRKAILYGIDARAERQIEALTRELGEQGVLELFGHKPDSDDVACKILWLKEQEPQIWKQADKFLTGSSYLTAKLTGNFVIDQYLAKSCFLPLYREDGSIDMENCGRFCRPEQLAPCARVTDVAGCNSAHLCFILTVLGRTWLACRRITSQEAICSLCREPMRWPEAPTAAALPPVGCGIPIMRLSWQPKQMAAKMPTVLWPGRRLRLPPAAMDC